MMFCGAKSGLEMGRWEMIWLKKTMMYNREQRFCMVLVTHHCLANTLWKAKRMMLQRRSARSKGTLQTSVSVCRLSFRWSSGFLPPLLPSSTVFYMHSDMPSKKSAGQIDFLRPPERAIYFIGGTALLLLHTCSTCYWGVARSPFCSSSLSRPYLGRLY